MQSPDHPYPVHFELPGYTALLGDFIHNVNEAVLKSHPMLGDMMDRPTRHRGPIRNVSQPSPVEHEHEPVSVTYKIPFELTRQGDVEGFVELLIRGVDEQFSVTLEKNLIRVLNDVTQATGSVIQVQGAAISFEHIISLYEKVEFNLDEFGHVRIPSIAANPKTLEILSKLEVSPDQAVRFRMLIQNKVASALRGRKQRKLRSQEGVK